MRFFPLLVAASLVAPAAAAAVNTQCQPGEKVHFSCAVKGGKVVSLCGDAGRSWLQYRFGPPGRPELVYPARKAGSVERFWGDAGSALQGEVRWLSVSFVSGGIGYKLEYLVPEGRPPFLGLRVGDPKRLDIGIAAPSRQAYPEAEIPCVDRSFDLISFDALVRALVDDAR